MFFGTFYTHFVLFNKLFIAREVVLFLAFFLELSWTWSYGSWIYNYLCNQCLSPLTLWVRIPLKRFGLDTTLCDKVYQW